MPSLNKRKKIKKPRSSSSRKNELQGILLILISLSLFLALVGYRPGNFSGSLMGYQISGFLIHPVTTFFGYAPSFFLPLILFIGGIYLFRRLPKRAMLKKISLLSILFFMSSTWLSLTNLDELYQAKTLKHLPFVKNKTVPMKSFYQTGGMIGNFCVEKTFVKIFKNSHFGPYLILSFLILLSVIWGIGWSLNAFLEKIIYGGLFLYHHGTRKLLALIDLIRYQWIQYNKRRLENRREHRRIQLALVKEKLLVEKLRKKEDLENSQLEKELRKQKLVEFLKERDTQTPEITEENDTLPNISIKPGEYLPSPPLPKILKPSITHRLGKEFDREENSVLESEKNQSPLSFSALESQSDERETPTEGPSFTTQKFDLYQKPSLDALADPPQFTETISREKLVENSKIIEQKFSDYSIPVKVVQVNPGPVITRYEIELGPGIKVNQIINAAVDVGIGLGGKKLRVISRIEGKSTVGIEMPNEVINTVFFKDLAKVLLKYPVKGLPFILGKTTAGEPFASEITEMPHLLIAGQTGSGKSVCINTLICSLLLTKTPEELRLIMIDPKRVELTPYNGIPHLLAPIITETKEAIKALKWVIEEMDRRYRLFSSVMCRNIEEFNKKMLNGQLDRSQVNLQDNQRFLPYIVLLIDEFADLMLTSGKEVEDYVIRITQLSRAVGIHLVIATQRPSVAVITGTIKANIPVRIAFAVAQRNDSRTILDANGAENLLGKGDNLFISPSCTEPIRTHGAYISSEEIGLLCNQINTLQLDLPHISSFAEEERKNLIRVEDEADEFFNEAAKIVVLTQQGSISVLQRKLKLGYNRAGRIIEQLESAGIVGPFVGSKQREVIVHSLEELQERFPEIG